MEGTNVMWYKGLYSPSYSPLSPILGKRNISSSVDLYFQPQKPGDKRVMFKSLFFTALLTNNRRAIEYKLYNCNWEG